MPGNGFLRCFRGVLHPESISKPFRSIFMTFEKIAFFRFSFVGFGHFGTRRIFYGFKTDRISAGTYSYTPWSFSKKWGPLGRGICGMPLEYVIRPHFPKIAYFDKVLRLLLLLRFGVPRCCFSESSTSGLSEKYMVYGVISSQ